MKEAKEASQKKSKVTIASNLTRVREMLDADGNVIDPKTKQIIRKANEK